MFAVLHVADFALHAVLRTARNSGGRPAALFSGTGKKSVVLAANPAARAAGVELGMTAPQGIARCPGLLIRVPDPAAEAEARAALLAVGFTLSPAIEDTAPGICTADLKGADPASLLSAARAAVTQLAALGLPATAGLARTPLLALYAARSAEPDLSHSSFSFSFSSDEPPPPPGQRKTKEKDEGERLSARPAEPPATPPPRAPDRAPDLDRPPLTPNASANANAITNTITIASTTEPTLASVHVVPTARPAEPDLSPSSFSFSFSSDESPPPPGQRKTKEKDEGERLSARPAEPPAAPLPRAPDRAPDRARALDRPPLAPNTSANAITNANAITSTITIASTTEPTLASVRLVPPPDEKSFLAPLPLAVADSSPELASVLHNWGLRTLGDLTSLPRDEIVRRFGSDGLALWQRATGGDSRPLHPVVPPQTFSAAMEFENAIETLEPLLFILRRFLDRLALELRASQHVTAELHLALQLEDDTTHARRFRLPEPTADIEILFRALHTHLESLTTPAAIVALQLDLTPARPLVRQQDLFETGLRDPHGFAETLARVSALVGADRVGTPRREDTHRPDTFTLAAPTPVIAPPAADPIHPPIAPPLRRFRPPLPVRLSAGDDGTLYLWSDRVQGEISFRSPPYPSSGDWWQQDRAWRRIESDIALAEGGLYRLVQIGREHFLEGEYD